MDYAERYNLLRREMPIDKILGNLVPYKDEAANPEESPLFDNNLKEFETE